MGWNYECSKEFHLTNFDRSKVQKINQHLVLRLWRGGFGDVFSFMQDNSRIKIFVKIILVTPSNYTTGFRGVANLPQDEINNLIDSMRC